MAKMATVLPRPEPRTCSFCGKTEHQAEALIVGVCACVCDECSDQIADLVAQRRAARLADRARNGGGGGR